MNSIIGKTLPRILVVGVEDIFTSNISSAFTARSFLEGWPEDCLRQVVCGDCEPSQQTFVLSNKNKWFYGLFSLRKPRPVSIKRDDTSFYKAKPTLKSIIHKRLVYAYSSLPYKRNKDLEKFIDNFNPDIIYSYSASYSVLKLIVKIANKRKIPFVPHFYDDWPNNLFSESKFFRGRVTSLVRSITKNAPVVFCICELMCQEYNKRYGGEKYQPLMHSVLPITKVQKARNTTNLIYAGSIYLGRYKSLLALCKELDNSNLPALCLTVYTNQQAWDEFKELFAPYPFVKYGGYVSQEELTKSIGNADGLVFIESLDEEMLVYTHYSMSTKIPEYLSSGNPILAIGNEKQGSISYLKEHNAAYIATSIKDIPGIVKSFSCKENLNEILTNAVTLFNANHLRTTQKERFAEIMIAASKKMC